MLGENMKYSIEDSNEELLVISDLDTMLKKIVNEFGDEAVFLNPFCIKCSAKIDIKSDVFSLYNVKEEQYLYCEKCDSPYDTI